VHIELPYADGFFFMRGYRGTVICHDLRKSLSTLKVVPAKIEVRRTLCDLTEEVGNTTEREVSQ
jgi:hypothetical protein